MEKLRRTILVPECEVSARNSATGEIVEGPFLAVMGFVVRWIESGHIVSIREEHTIEEGGEQVG